MKKKILIIEDEFDLANMYKYKLELDGFEVVVARDGETGIKKAREFMPDFVLLDIVLPYKDGYEVLKAIRGSEDLKHLTVYAWTNLGQNAEIKKGMDYGADGYWVKTNLTPGQLVGNIKKILGVDDSGKEK